MLSRLLINTWVWIGGRHYASWASLVAQLVKNLPVMQETWVQSLGQEDPLENIMAAHSSILAWRIPWTEEPGRLQSMGLQRVGHDWVTFTLCWLCKIGSEWVKVAQSCPTLCDPMDYTVCGILQARILEWVAFPFSRQSSQPRDQTQISRVEGRFFTSWATGKPKNIGVGSLSLLQQIFPTQESNRGLLHCRWILYQLSYQGSP